MQQRNQKLRQGDRSPPNSSPQAQTPREKSRNTPKIPRSHHVNPSAPMEEEEADTAENAPINEEFSDLEFQNRPSEWRQVNNKGRSQPIINPTVFLDEIGGAEGWKGVLIHGFKQSRFKMGSISAPLAAEVESLLSILDLQGNIVQSSKHWIIGSNFKGNFGVMCQLVNPGRRPKAGFITGKPAKAGWKGDFYGFTLLTNSEMNLLRNDFVCMGYLHGPDGEASELNIQLQQISRQLNEASQGAPTFLLALPTIGRSGFEHHQCLQDPNKAGKTELIKGFVCCTTKRACEPVRKHLGISPSSNSGQAWPVVAGKGFGSYSIWESPESFLRALRDERTDTTFPGALYSPGHCLTIGNVNCKSSLELSDKLELIKKFKGKIQWICAHTNKCFLVGLSAEVSVSTNDLAGLQRDKAEVFYRYSIRTPGREEGLSLRMRTSKIKADKCLYYKIQQQERLRDLKIPSAFGSSPPREWRHAVRGQGPAVPSRENRGHQSAASKASESQSETTNPNNGAEDGLEHLREEFTALREHIGELKKSLQGMEKENKLLKSSIRNLEARRDESSKDMAEARSILETITKTSARAELLQQKQSQLIDQRFRELFKHPERDISKLEIQMDNCESGIRAIVECVGEHGISVVDKYGHLEVGFRTPLMPNGSDVLRKQQAANDRGKVQRATNADASSLSASPSNPHTYESQSTPTQATFVMEVDVPPILEPGEEKATGKRYVRAGEEEPKVSGNSEYTTTDSEVRVEVPQPDFLWDADTNDTSQVNSEADQKTVLPIIEEESIIDLVSPDTPISVTGGPRKIPKGSAAKARQAETGLRLPGLHIQPSELIIRHKGKDFKLSNLNQLGLFSSQLIPKGTIICDAVDCEPISQEEYMLREVVRQESGKGLYGILLRNGMILTPLDPDASPKGLMVANSIWHAIRTDGRAVRSNAFLVTRGSKAYLKASEDIRGSPDGKIEICFSYGNNKFFQDPTRNSILKAELTGRLLSQETTEESPLQDEEEMGLILRTPISAQEVADEICGSSFSLNSLGIKLIAEAGQLRKIMQATDLSTRTEGILELSGIITTHQSNLATKFDCIGAGWCGLHAIYFLHAEPDERVEILKDKGNQIYSDYAIKKWRATLGHMISDRQSEIIRFLEENGQISRLERFQELTETITMHGREGKGIPYLLAEDLFVLSEGHLPVIWEHNPEDRSFILSFAPHLQTWMPLGEMVERIPTAYEPGEPQIMVGGSHFVITDGIDVGRDEIISLVEFATIQIGKELDGYRSFNNQQWATNV